MKLKSIWNSLEFPDSRVHHNAKDAALNSGAMRQKSDKPLAGDQKPAEYYTENLNLYQE